MTTATPASQLVREAPRVHGTERSTRSAAGRRAISSVADRLATASTLVRRLPVIALLVGTGVLYPWDLSASGYANSIYSAAVQAGSQSWTAFFYGSLDAGNSITVGTPPASLWLMALSVRIFGLSSWSILVPQALMGVASVGVLYATVRRSSGQGAAWLAGVILALTPVAALVFRFNDPDALLVLGLSLAVLCTTIATERASGRWLTVAGVFVGLGFLTKVLQAFLIVPTLGVVYLIAAPTPVRARIGHLFGAAVAMIGTLGWWVAVVELVPATWRPYIGGSEHNSILELIWGDGGLVRILGAGAGYSTGEAIGITRLFGGVAGGMVAWLIPAALIMSVFAFVTLGRAPRTDRRRTALIMMSGWLVVTGFTFSFVAGVDHDYETVALAPGIAGSVAVAGAVLLAARDTVPGRLGLAVSTAATATCAVILLGAATPPYSTLRWPIAVLGAVATVAWIFAGRWPHVLVGVLTASAVAVGLIGPVAYTLDTVGTPHTGSIITAGPVSGRGISDGTGGGSVTAELRGVLTTNAMSYTWIAATDGAQRAAAYQLSTGYPVVAIGGVSGSDPSPTLPQFQQLVAAGRIHYYVSSDLGRRAGRRTAQWWWRRGQPDRGQSDRGMGERARHRDHRRTDHGLRPDHAHPMNDAYATPPDLVQDKTKDTMISNSTVVSARIDGAHLSGPEHPSRRAPELADVEFVIPVSNEEADLGPRFDACTVTWPPSSRTTS